VFVGHFDQSINPAHEQIWRQDGPVAHPAGEAYRRLALQLVVSLIAGSTDWQAGKTEPLVLNLPHGRVLVRPNVIIKSPDQNTVLCKVRTGFKRSREYDRPDYVLYQLAGQERFGAEVVVRVLHLADSVSEDIPISQKKSITIDVK